MTMIAVLVSCTILMTVVLGSAAFLSSSTKFSRYEQDSDLAFSAAQSGLNDLLTRLRADPAFLETLEMNSQDPGSYCLSEATGGPDEDVFADICGWSTSTNVNWAEITSAQTSARQYFHYVITFYDEISQSIDVTATGKSRNVVRSITARLAPVSTPMYLYISNYELADPTDYTTYTREDVYGGGQLTSMACGAGWAPGSVPGDLHYEWEVGTTDPVTGKKIPPRRYNYTGLEQACFVPAFDAWDTLQGRIHSNDTIRARGTVFIVDPEWTTAKKECLAAGDPLKDCIDGNATWQNGGPKYHEKMDMPTTASAATAAADGAGCTYEGNTRIVLEGSSMTVWAPETKNTKTGCGSLAALKSAAGAVVNIPAEADGPLVYIAPSDATPAELKAGSIGGLPLGTYTGAAISSSTNYTEEIAVTRQEKFAGRGNVYIQGYLSGHLTVAADESVIVTGDLTTVNDETDLLGLIGTSIEIYNPVLQRVKSAESGNHWIPTVPEKLDVVSGWPQNLDGEANILTIEAAIHATTGSFRLQNWRDGGDKGTLRVFGSIAQNFRGVVAWASVDGSSLISGYRKNYVYNSALTKGRPLLFSPLSGGSWAVLWGQKAQPHEALQP
jgi:Tfp pilus assembly protein PilX